MAMRKSPLVATGSSYRLKLRGEQGTVWIALESASHRNLGRRGRVRSAKHLCEVARTPQEPPVVEVPSGLVGLADRGLSDHHLEDDVDLLLPERREQGALRQRPIPFDALAEGRQEGVVSDHVHAMTPEFLPEIADPREYHVLSLI